MIHSFVEYTFFVIVHATWIAAAIGFAGIAALGVVPGEKAVCRRRIGLATILICVASVPILACAAVLSPPPIDGDHSELKWPSAGETRGPSRMENGLSNQEPIISDSSEMALNSSLATRPDWQRVVLPTLKSTIVAVYLTGFLACLARLAIDLYRIHRLRRQSRAAPENVIEVIRNLGPEYQNTPQVLCSNETSTPMLVGFISPVIILPRNLAMAGTHNQIEAVFLHETAHYRSWDHFWLPIQKLAQSILFFHPGLLVLDRMVECERELAADQLACKHKRSSPATYALTLVEIADNLRCQADGLAITFVGRKSYLTQRVRFILDPNASRPGGWWLTLTVLLVACFSAGLTFASPPQISAECRWEVFSSEKLATDPTPDSISRNEQDYALVGKTTLSVERDTSLRVRGRCTAFEFCESQTGKLVVAAYQPRTTNANQERWSFTNSVSISRHASEITIKDIRGSDPEYKEQILLKIFMPHSMSVDLRTFKGDLTINRSLSNLDANLWGGDTRIGPVTLEHTQIKTGVGTISANAKLLANSVLSAGSGKLMVCSQAIDGEVILRCGSGDLMAEIDGIAKSGFLTIATQSGDARTEVPQNKLGQIKFQSKTGNVYVNERLWGADSGE